MSDDNASLSEIQQGTLAKFKSSAQRFADYFCEEYMQKVSVEWDLSDPDSPTAEVLCEDMCHMKWSVPLAPKDDGSHEAAISIGDCGQLDADGEGLYAFLWNEACQRLRKHGITGDD